MPLSEVNPLKICMFQVMLLIFILYGSLILMNLLVALMVSKTDSEKAEISLVTQRIEEISGATNIIQALKVFRKIKDAPKSAPKVCVTSALSLQGKLSIWTRLRDFIDRRIIFRFSSYRYWTIKEHIPPNDCANLSNSKNTRAKDQVYRVRQELVKLTITMLKERKNTNAELMKEIREIQAETEKEVKKLEHEEENDLSLNDVDKDETCSGKRCNKIDARLDSLDARLESLETTLTNISADLGVLLKQLKN